LSTWISFIYALKMVHGHFNRRRCPILASLKCFRQLLVRMFEYSFVVRSRNPVFDAKLDFVDSQRRSPPGWPIRPSTVKLYALRLPFCSLGYPEIIVAGVAVRMSSRSVLYNCYSKSVLGYGVMAYDRRDDSRCTRRTLVQMRSTSATRTSRRGHGKGSTLLARINQGSPPQIKPSSVSRRLP
jgi:hypothetical protein